MTFVRPGVTDRLRRGRRAADPADPLLRGSSLLAYELDLAAVRGSRPIQARYELRCGGPPARAGAGAGRLAAIAPLLRLGWECCDGTLQAVVTVRGLALDVVVGLGRHWAWWPAGLAHRGRIGPAGGRLGSILGVVLIFEADQARATPSAG